jgi:LysR family glycine cleavage system transcriptional activator
MKAVSSFYVVYPAEAIRQRKVRIFRDWLLAEINQQRGSSSASRPN